MLPPKPSPCRECPFRRTSLPGYVGADTVEQFAATAHYGEEPMPCHLEVDYGEPDWQEQLDGVRQCTGHAIFLGNTCKHPRNEEVATLPADHKAVFSSGREFIKHHGGDDTVMFCGPTVVYPPKKKKQPKAKTR